MYLQAMWQLCDNNADNILCTRTQICYVSNFSNIHAIKTPTIKAQKSAITTPTITTNIFYVHYKTAAFLSMQNNKTSSSVHLFRVRFAERSHHFDVEKITVDIRLHANFPCTLLIGLICLSGYGDGARIFETSFHFVCSSLERFMYIVNLCHSFNFLSNEKHTIII